MADFFRDTDWALFWATTGFILEGLGVTLKVFAVTIVFSIPIGILCAIGKMAHFPPLRWLLEGYTWLFRGTPLLLQLFFAYYGLAIMVDIELSPINAALVTFALNYGAYFTEIFRGGIQTVESGQYEAARVLGLSYPQTMRRIVLPQAFKAVLPPMTNEAINLIKDTALCATLAIPEILKNTKSMVSSQYNPSLYFVAAVIYLALTFLVILVFKRIEKKFSYYNN